jgi:hypothetical protein
LAELIRAAAGQQNRLERLIDCIWALAIEPHDDPRIRISAAEWLAKHGWPEESRGKTMVTAETGTLTIVHEYHGAGGTRMDPALGAPTTQSASPDWRLVASHPERAGFA